MSNLPEQNITTGLIKGSGIASSFRNIYQSYGPNESRRARYYLISLQEFIKFIIFFPNPIVQMYRADRITANKLLKIGGKDWLKEDFEEFTQEIKEEVTRNYEKYNIEGEYRNGFVGIQ